MAGLVVGGYEAAVTGKRGWCSVFCLAGVAGVWTLPTFVLPVAGAVVALLVIAPDIRRMLVPRLAVGAGAVSIWYASTIGDLLHSTSQHWGHPLPWDAPLTGGFSLFAAGPPLTKR